MGNILAKLTQRKRRNELDNESSGTETSVAGPSNGNENSVLSPIFKLNGHCFDELFEYLSLMDLHSLGQTCKSLQQKTGEFFKLNYSAVEVVCLSDGLYAIHVYYDKYFYRQTMRIPISGFIKYVTSIAIEHIEKPRKITSIRHHNDLMNRLNYIKLHADELNSVKKISLKNVHLNQSTVKCLIKFLPNIEVLELKCCKINQDFYDVLLKYCKNLRRIQLIGLKKQMECKWLLQRYEKLEHLDLNLQVRVVDKTSEKIDELCTFFDCNPSVRSFSCDIFTFWFNKDAFLDSKAQLDTFELQYINMWKNFEWTTLLWDVLHRLHNCGFYKRLHIVADEFKRLDELPATPFLEKLCIGHYECNLEPHLITFLNECIEFHLDDYWRHRRIEFPVENLIKVERLYLYHTHIPCKSVDILLIMQKLKNLREFKLHNFKPGEILQLESLNMEREKLEGARKVTIYVPDVVYLATKWATRDGITNLSMIEMRRIESYEWSKSSFHGLPFPPIGKIKYSKARIKFIPRVLYR